MRFSIYAATALFALTTSATDLLSVIDTALSSATSTHCLTSTDATTLATNFGKLVSAYSEKLANQTLATNFQDYSESVNSLIDNGGTAPVALLGQTFASRAAFESLSATQPSVPFALKNVWFTCDTITYRWESDQTPQPVIGISVAHTVYSPVKGNPSNFLIDEIWGEFDSAAWLINAGVLKVAKRAVAFKA